jgi:hypothetical protein
MYTDPLLLSVTNLNERGAVFAITADLAKLAEKGRLTSGAALSIKNESPRFTKSAKKLLTNDLTGKFTNIDLKFIKNSSVIIATVTPK